MILLVLLGVIVAGCALVLTMAALSHYEAERQIKRLAARRVPVVRHPRRRQR